MRQWQLERAFIEPWAIAAHGATFWKAEIMSLAAELADFRQSFMGKVPAEVRDAMMRADMALAASGITERAVKAGDEAPEFTLPSTHGELVRLRALIANGPVVISFYRGGWRPYCNFELRALQSILPHIQALGASIVEISPQTPGESLTTAEKNALQFTVLSDSHAAAAKAYGVAFDLAEELRPLYAKFGNALPEKNGDNSWVLPIRATFVVDRYGTIALAFVDTDYGNRLEPADIVAALETLAGKAAA
jgi:peroxiredoxin